MTDLFNQEPSTTNTQAQQSAYESLVGDGKKFKDTEALAKSKLESDKFIGTLQEENAKLRAEVQKRITTEELLEKIKQEGLLANQSSQGNTNTPSQPNAPSETINKEEIQNLINQSIEQNKRLSTAQQNVEYVRSELENALGSDYVEKLKHRAKELGLTQEFVSAMAEQTPEALLKIVIGETRQNPNSFVAPRTTQPRPVETTDPVKQKWDEAKKTRAYRNSDIQLAIHRRSIEAGRSILD